MLGLGLDIPQIANMGGAFKPSDISDLNIWYDFSNVGTLYDDGEDVDNWKNKGLLPGNITIKKRDMLERAILRVYTIYQEKILVLNACDFGDLLLHCVSIFENKKLIIIIE